jgi:ankyrin repeat protein
MQIFQFQSNERYFHLCKQQPNMSNRLLDDFADSIERNDLNQINSMLSNREVDANWRLPRENHPPALVLAVRHGRAEIVELLLNSGALIDEVDANGHSACHVAARLCNSEVLRLLLAHQPNLALKSIDGETALQCAIRAIKFHNVSEENNVALLLIGAGASPQDVGRQHLCEWAATSTIVIQALTDRGVVVGDLRDYFGRTPLLCALRDDPDSVCAEQACRLRC